VEAGFGCGDASLVWVAVIKERERERES